MKIKIKHMDYEKVMALPRPEHRSPLYPSRLLRAAIRVLAMWEMFRTKFTYTTERMEEVGDEPCLILMNHSSFLDLKIASRIFFPKPYCIVCTTDGFVGKSWLMRWLGCIPTLKFVSDLQLIRDMQYALKKKRANVLMFPEAGYTFDGCALPLPQRMSVLVKKLDVPIVTVITHGSFAYDPLYNCLQKRRVKANAEVKCILTREEIRTLPAEEIDRRIKAEFTFDNFKWQHDNKIEITESFRADGLERILYKCAACGAEGGMKGSGTTLTCSRCGKTYTMDVLGRLQAHDGVTEYPHIPDWYNWQRSCVRRELEAGEYALDTDVDIGLLVDHKALYMVGEGHLTHDANGFVLTGCGGKLHYEQSPLAAYSLNSDYFWYEIGDVICIGNKDCLYYCFPRTEGVVTKTRFAAEELYKMNKTEKRRRMRAVTE